MNTIEKKTRLFLDMQEHPEHYSEEELQSMLDDAEMSKVIDSFNLLRQAALCQSGGVTDEEISAEWEKLRDEQEKVSSNVVHATLFKVAAAFIGCLLMAGLTYAAIRLIAEREPMPIASDASTQEEKAGTAVQMSSAAQEVTVVAAVDSIVRFDDAEFETVIGAMAEHYGVKVEFKSEEARHIRMFFIWNKNQSLADVLDVLNGYDRISVALADETLTVK